MRVCPARGPISVSIVVGQLTAFYARMWPECGLTSPGRIAACCLVRKPVADTGRSVSMRGSVALLAAGLSLAACGSGGNSAQPSVVTTVLVPRGSPVQIPVQTNVQLSEEVAQLQTQIGALQGEVECLRQQA